MNETKTWKPGDQDQRERDNTKEDDVEPLNDEVINCSDVTLRFSPQAEHVRVIHDFTVLDPQTNPHPNTAQR